jgi:hypothetical protein
MTTKGKASFGAEAAFRPEASGRNAKGAPQDDGKSCMGGLWDGEEKSKSPGATTASGAPGHPGGEKKDG